MIRLSFLITFVAWALVSAGQDTTPAGSLRKVLQRYPAGDTGRVTPLLQAADAILFTDPGAAMRYTDEALEIAEKKQWAKGIALSFRQKGNVYYVLSDNAGAMDSYMKALKTALPLKIKQLDASLFNNLANIYSDLKQYDKALDYYRQFLAASRELKMTKEETIALVNMGTVYSELNEHAEALDCNRQALDIARRNNNTNFIPIILNNMGTAFAKKGDTAQALDWFAQCITVSQRYGNNDAKASALGETAKIYLARGDDNHAQNYAQQSLQVARQLHAAERESAAWQTLYTVYEHRRQFDKALSAYKSFILFRDSVLNDEKRSVLTRKEMQFDFERKEALLKAENDKKQALASAEIRRQSLIKRGTLAASAILLLAAIAGFVLYKRRRDAEERKKEADLKAKVSDTEMKVLRLQMNPHFIFNTLNAVADYISKHETATANHYLIKFAKVMRLVLENSEKTEITLAEDLQALEMYMQLEALRLKNDLTYEIMVDEDIDQEATLVPPLILQPFVENSIRHGIAGGSCPGKVSIRIRKNDGMISCVVEDNGIGRKKAGDRAIAGKRSMGLKITRDRLDVINLTKKTNAGVEIFDLPEGTRVELNLPLELNF